MLCRTLACSLGFGQHSKHEHEPFANCRSTEYAAPVVVKTDSEEGANTVQLQPLDAEGALPRIFRRT